MKKSIVALSVASLLVSQSSFALQCGDIKTGAVVGSGTLGVLAGGAALLKLHKANKIVRENTSRVFRGVIGQTVDLQRLPLNVKPGDQITVNVALSPERSAQVYVESLESEASSDTSSGALFSVLGVENAIDDNSGGALLDGFVAASDFSDAAAARRQAAAIRAGTQRAPQQYETETLNVESEQDARIWLSGLQRNGDTLSDILKVPAEALKASKVAKSGAVTTGLVAAAALIIAAEEATASVVSSKLEQRLIGQLCR